MATKHVAESGPNTAHPPGTGSAARVIDLTRLKKVAQGNRRDVYFVPTGETGFEHFSAPLVLKVPRYADRRTHHRRSKRLKSILLPFSMERVSRVEVNYWKKLAARFDGDPAQMPLPVFRGYVNTSDGRGTLWDAMCDSDGKLAPTLRQLKRAGVIEELVDPLNRFAAFCYEYNVVAPDIQGVNLVRVERAGRPEVVLIDGFGDMRIFSTRELSRRRNRTFMDHRFGKTAISAGMVFNPATRQFSMPPE